MGIADKLRNFAENWASNDAERELAREAAEEIETLRYRLNFMEERFGRIQWGAVQTNGHQGGAT
jgi:hypothetical protein